MIAITFILFPMLATAAKSRDRDAIGLEPAVHPLHAPERPHEDAGAGRPPDTVHQADPERREGRSAERVAVLREIAALQEEGFHVNCYVDDELVRAQEGGFYGGWITSDLVGPFKGAPGTRGW